MVELDEYSKADIALRWSQAAESRQNAIVWWPTLQYHIVVQTVHCDVAADSPPSPCLSVLPTINRVPAATLTVVHRVLQTKERRAGAADVVLAGEPQGADGAAGGTDEAAQGDQLWRRPIHSILLRPPCGREPRFSLSCFLPVIFFFFLTLLQRGSVWHLPFLSFFSHTVSPLRCGPVGWGTAAGRKFAHVCEVWLLLFML